MRHSLVLNNTPRVWLSYSNCTLIVPCGPKNCNRDGNPQNLSGGNKNMETLGTWTPISSFFLDKKKKARSSMINSREWSCSLAEQVRMGCSICPQPSAMPCPAFPCLCFFFFNPPSWINAIGLVLTRRGSDSALAKWHAACGTWAREADCCLLWGKKINKACREGLRGGGWGTEQFCANHPLPILLTSPRLLLLWGGGRREPTRLKHW